MMSTFSSLDHFVVFIWLVVLETFCFPYLSDLVKTIPGDQLMIVYHDLSILNHVWMA